MNSQKGIVGCLLLACTLQMSAQVKTYKYRVNFRDKAETTYALDKPSAYLSERALERRMKQGLPVDSTDIPVCRSYIDMLVGKGAQLVSKSKWNNTVVVQVSDTSVIDKVAALPFVTAVRKVWTAPDSIPARNANRKKEVTNRVGFRCTSSYISYFRQEYGQTPKRYREFWAEQSKKDKALPLESETTITEKRK